MSETEENRTNLRRVAGVISNTWDDLYTRKESLEAKLRSLDAEIANLNSQYQSRAPASSQVSKPVPKTPAKTQVQKTTQANPAQANPAQAKPALPKKPQTPAHPTGHFYVIYPPLVSKGSLNLDNTFFDLFGIRRTTIDSSDSTKIQRGSKAIYIGVADFFSDVISENSLFEYERVIDELRRAGVSVYPLVIQNIKNATEYKKDYEFVQGAKLLLYSQGDGHLARKQIIITSAAIDVVRDLATFLGVSLPQLSIQKLKMAVSETDPYISTKLGGKLENRQTGGSQGKTKATNAGSSGAKIYSFWYKGNTPNQVESIQKQFDALGLKGELHDYSDLEDGSIPSGSKLLIFDYKTSRRLDLEFDKEWYEKLMNDGYSVLAVIFSPKMEISSEEISVPNVRIGFSYESKGPVVYASQHDKREIAKKIGELKGQKRTATQSSYGNKGVYFFWKDDKTPETPDEFEKKLGDLAMKGQVNYYEDLSTVDPKNSKIVIFDYQLGGRIDLTVKKEDYENLLSQGYNFLAVIFTPNGERVQDNLTFPHVIISWESEKNVTLPVISGEDWATKVKTIEKFTGQTISAAVKSEIAKKK